MNGIARALPLRRHALVGLLLAGAGLLGCPAGDGSEGQAPIASVLSTPDCRLFASTFPSGLTLLPGTNGEAAAVQFEPTAVVGVDLRNEPPTPLAIGGPPALAELPGDRPPTCIGPQRDSDLDGRPDDAWNDALGFGCIRATPGTIEAFDADLAAVTTSGYEQLLLFAPRSGAQRTARLATASARPTFDPADWPFWPAPGIEPFTAGFSTRACVYGTGLTESSGRPIGANTRCDGSRDGFFTTFTADLAIDDDRLFVVTSNLLTGDRFFPGTLLAFDFDRTTTPPTVRPRPEGAVHLTTGYNPTSVVLYETPAGRRLVLVGQTGALVSGAPPIPIRTDSAIDVFDAETLALIATIPMGPAGLGFDGLVIDATRRLGLIGAATTRSLFGIDLAALDDPLLGLGPETLPIVLDGGTPGFRDARVFDAARPFALPKRADGPLDSVCATQTAVALRDDNAFAVTTDACDGTLTRLRLALPVDRAQPIDPVGVLTVDRVLEITAPVLPSTLSDQRFPDRPRIRPGTPGIDFAGPDVSFLVGEPESAICSVRVDAL